MFFKFFKKSVVPFSFKFIEKDIQNIDLGLLWRSHLRFPISKSLGKNYLMFFPLEEGIPLVKLMYL